MKKILSTFLIILFSGTLFCQTVQKSSLIKSEEPERLNHAGNYITGFFFGADLSVFQFLDPQTPLIPQYSLDIKGGYKLTPVWGARAIAGIGANKTTYNDTRFNISGNYIGCYYQADFCFDITEAFFASRENDYNMILFVGAGSRYSFGRGDKFYSNTYQVNTIWRYTTQQTYQTGIINSWYLDKDITFNVEVQAQIISKRWQGVDIEYTPQLVPSLKLGITYYFNNRDKFNSYTPILSEPSSGGQSTPSERDETIQRVHEYMNYRMFEDKSEKSVVEKSIDKVSVNIFFDLNKAVVKSQEKDKLRSIAQRIASHPENKIKILGFSDMMTGNSGYNLALSEKRAIEVASILVNEFGIPTEKITYYAKGDTEQPFTSNQLNRVCIVVAE